MNKLDTLRFRNKGLDSIDDCILDNIVKHGTINTYRLSKLIDVSWSTIYTHCYKLAAKGILKHKIDTKMFKKTIIWSIL